VHRLDDAAAERDRELHRVRNTFDNARTATFCAGAHALTLQQHLPSGDVFEVLTLTR